MSLEDIQKIPPTGESFVHQQAWWNCSESKTDLQIHCKFKPGLIFDVQYLQPS